MVKTHQRKLRLSLYSLKLDSVFSHMSPRAQRGGGGEHEARLHQDLKGLFLFYPRFTLSSLFLDMVESRRKKLGHTEDLASPETPHSPPLCLRKTLLFNIKDINTVLKSWRRASTTVEPNLKRVKPSLGSLHQSVMSQCRGPLWWARDTLIRAENKQKPGGWAGLTDRKGKPCTVADCSS